MNTRIRAVWLAGLLYAAAPVIAEEAAARPVEWAQPVKESSNLFKVADRLYRSAQPLRGDVSELQSLGVTTVISFRAFHDDSKLLQQSGIKMIRVPMNTWDIHDRHIVAALQAIRQGLREGPVLIHCQHGADRTGLVSAMYRIVEQGWSKEAALKELKEGGYGYHAMWQNIPKFIERVDVEAIKARL